MITVSQIKVAAVYNVLSFEKSEVTSAEKKILKGV